MFIHSVLSCFNPSIIWHSTPATQDHWGAGLRENMQTPHRTAHGPTENQTQEPCNMLPLSLAHKLIFSLVGAKSWPVPSKGFNSNVHHCLWYISTPFPFPAGSTSSSTSDHWLVRLVGGSKRGSLVSGGPSPVPPGPTQAPESPELPVFGDEPPKTVETSKQPREARAVVSNCLNTNALRKCDCFLSKCY